MLHFKIFDKVELGEGNVAVLSAANTGHYDAELDYSRGCREQYLSADLGRNLPGSLCQVKSNYEDMVDSEELRHLQVAGGGFSFLAAEDQEI